MKVRNAPPVQPCATTRVGVTSESLLRRSRKFYKFAQPPAGSLHRRRELASGPGLRETSKLHFRSLQPVTIRVCLSYWPDRFLANSARDYYFFRASSSLISAGAEQKNKESVRGCGICCGQQRSRRFWETGLLTRSLLK